MRPYPPCWVFKAHVFIRLCFVDAPTAAMHLWTVHVLENMLITNGLYQNTHSDRKQTQGFAYNFHSHKKVKVKVMFGHDIFSNVVRVCN